MIFIWFLDDSKNVFWEKASCRQHAERAAIADPVYEVFGNLQGTPEAAKIWNETFAEEYANKQNARRFSEAVGSLG